MTLRQRISRAVAAVIVATALIAIYITAVQATGFMPRCIFKVATGWSCPGCGSQRALQAILHGHLSQAIEANLLLPIGIAYLSLLGLTWMLADNPAMQRMRSYATSPKALYITVAIIVIWTIIRNILGI